MNIGDTVPNFSLPTNGGGSFELSQHAGKPLIIYFYPKDATPGCTTQAQDFRDTFDAFQQAGCAIVGISKDSVRKHDNFAGKHALPFPLGSDADSDVCERFGVWVEKSMYGKTYMGIERSTFLLAADGTLAAQWRKVKVKGHVAQVLEAVRAL